MATNLILVGALVVAILISCAFFASVRADVGWSPRFERALFWVAVGSSFVACWLAAWLAAPLLGLDFKISFLLSMCLGLLIYSWVIRMWERKIRLDVEQTAKTDRDKLAKIDPIYRYAIPRNDGMSARTAVRVGVTLIIIMPFPVIVAPLAVSQEILGIESNVVNGLCVALGFVLYWACWSVGVTIWRCWAAKRGVDADELQWRGERAQLLNPEGSFFSKTELGNVIAWWRRRYR